MTRSQTYLAALVAAICLALLYVALHFVDRFRRRRHPLSVVAALLPVGWALSAVLVLEPALSTWRALVLTLAALESAASVFLVYVARLAEKHVQED